MNCYLFVINHRYVVEKRGRVYRYGFMRYCSVDHGVILNNTYAIQYAFDEPFKGYVFEGNYNTHTLAVYDIEENKLTERISVVLRHNCVVKFKESTHYWEGDVYDTRPYGWGCLYDKDGHLLYEGFRIDSLNLCFGTSYYSDGGCIRYRGSYYFGLQWGEGTLYDKNGAVLYQGAWLNNRKSSAMTIRSVHDLHSVVEELYVSDGSANAADITALDLSFYLRLKTILVGRNCFACVASFVVKHAPVLKEVQIAGRSFIRQGANTCVLENCPALRKLTVSRGAFPQFKSMVLTGECGTVR